MKLIILSILLVLAFSLKDDPKYWSTNEEQDQSLQTETPKANEPLWFKQVVDHFNYQSVSTWNQRYWVYNNFFNPNVGPVFVFICG